MRLIFIRHAEPDYEIDSLTTKGWREAKLLAERVKNWKVDNVFVSPLGRAQDTASFSVKELGIEPVTLDWLREFGHPVNSEITGVLDSPWDFLPEFFTNEPLLYHKDTWLDADIIRSNPDIQKCALNTFKEFDALLASYGYMREGGFYRVDNDLYNNKKGDNDDITLVFVCHLGISLLLMGYMMGISPSLLWQSIFVAPSSVTVLNAEIRQNDAAYFRAQVIGDTRHLKDEGEPVSKSGYYAAPFQD